MGKTENIGNISITSTRFRRYIYPIDRNNSKSIANSASTRISPDVTLLFNTLPKIICELVDVGQGLKKVGIKVGVKEGGEVDGGLESMYCR